MCQMQKRRGETEKKFVNSAERTRKSNETFTSRNQAK